MTARSYLFCIFRAESELTHRLALRLEAGASCFYHYRGTLATNGWRVPSYTVSTCVWFGRFPPYLRLKASVSTDAFVMQFVVALSLHTVCS